MLPKIYFTTRMQYVNSKINMAEMYNENPYELT